MFGNMTAKDIKALGVGLELSMVIGGMTYCGYWLDERFGTEPWLMLLGVCIGTCGGGWHAIKMANGGKLPNFGFTQKKKADQPEARAKNTDDGDEKPKP